MTGFASEYEAHCAAHGRPERIELLLCDINAVLRGKWLPGDQAKKLVSGGVRLPLSTYAPNILGAEVEETGLGIVAGDPDGQLMPVAGSLRPVPWAEGNIAQVQVEMLAPEGGISPLSGASFWPASSAASPNAACVRWWPRSWNSTCCSRALAPRPRPSLPP